jgi:hypothetical protein
MLGRWINRTQRLQEQALTSGALLWPNTRKDLRTRSQNRICSMNTNSFPESIHPDHPSRLGQKPKSANIHLKYMH